MMHSLVLISRVFDLARDAGYGEAAPDRPLNGVTLTLGKLDILA